MSDHRPQPALVNDSDEHPVVGEAVVMPPATVRRLPDGYHRHPLDDRFLTIGSSWFGYLGMTMIDQLISPLNSYHLIRLSAGSALYVAQGCGNFRLSG